jgi:hypothetical protein
MTITRKEFLSTVARYAAGAVGVGAMAQVAAACGSNDPKTPDAAAAKDSSGVSTCTTNGTTSTIASNHGHVLMVSAADVVAAVAKTYDITGTASHTHTVMVTVAHFASLKAGTPIMTTTSTDSAHSHMVTVMCA